MAAINAHVMIIHNIIMFLELAVERMDDKRNRRDARDQAFFPRNYRAKVIKEQGGSNCRMCGQRVVTVIQILSECEKHAQRDYKKRHCKLKYTFVCPYRPMIGHDCYGFV